MQIQMISDDRYLYYCAPGYEDLSYSPETGKWIIFCKTLEWASSVCRKIVNDGVVLEAKHPRNEEHSSIPCMFYLEESDLNRHMKFIEYAMENDILPKKKDGGYCNIAFKLDIETKLGLYGDSFRGILHLSDFIDVNTGNWKEEIIIRRENLLNRESVEKKTARMTSEYLDIGISNRFGAGSLVMKKGDLFNGSFVKEYIKNNNISIKEMASQLDVSEASLRSWLNEKSRPYAWNAFAIAAYLGLEKDDVIKHIQRGEIAE